MFCTFVIIIFSFYSFLSNYTLNAFFKLLAFRESVVYKLVEKYKFLAHLSIVLNTFPIYIKGIKPDLCRTIPKTFNITIVANAATSFNAPFFADGVLESSDTLSLYLFINVENSVASLPGNKFIISFCNIGSLDVVAAWNSIATTFFFMFVVSILILSNLSISVLSFFILIF